MSSHARLSPSASYIWMNCPGQPRLAGGLERRASSYAEQGTAAHEVLERCLNTGFDAAAWIERRPPAFPLDETDADAIQIALDFIRGEIAEGDETETEVRLKHSDDYWGTADFVRYRPSSCELLVVDYKHGSGVPVEALGNPQGVGYALMKAKMLGNRGIAKVRFVIVQPRCFHDLGPIREYEVDGCDLLEWQSKIEDAIAATHADDAPLNAGSHCRWCPAAGICPAIEQMAVTEAQNTFEPVDPLAGPEAPAYDVAKLAAALSRLDAIEAYAKATREFAYAEAERGVVIPGFKLVQKKAHRRYKDPERARAAIEINYDLTEDDLFDRSFKSPAQMEATLEPFMPGRTKTARLEAARKFLKEHVEAVSSGHTLVPESDPRPPIRQRADDDFDPVE